MVSGACFSVIFLHSHAIPGTGRIAVFRPFRTRVMLTRIPATLHANLLEEHGSTNLCFKLCFRGKERRAQSFCLQC